MTGDAGALTILFVSLEYPPETGGGGIGSYVATMAPALAARGHDVHVLSCAPGLEPADTVDRGVRIHRRRVRRFAPSALRQRAPAAADRLDSALSAYLEARSLGLSSDVVEAPDWLAEGLVFSLLRARPLVVHLHTPLLLIARHASSPPVWKRNERLADLLERSAARRADVLTSPSRLLAGDLADWVGGRSIRLVPYPVEVESWQDVPSAAATSPLVLSVGRLERRKGQDVLVRALGKLAGLGVAAEAVFIGRVPGRAEVRNRERLIELAREVGARCRFVEQVPRSELAAWYGAARVVVLSSRYDNFPFVALEGMASGRPIVCTSATGTAEIVSGTAAGSVVPPDDEDALATAVRPYLADADLAARSGEAARELVRRRCAPDVVAAEREDCYLAAIERWSAGRPFRPVRVGTSGRRRGP